nr:aspartyl protease family protein [Sphingobium fuliginis]
MDTLCVLARGHDFGSNRRRWRQDSRNLGFWSRRVDGRSELCRPSEDSGFLRRPSARGSRRQNSGVEKWRVPNFYWRPGRLSALGGPRRPFTSIAGYGLARGLPPGSRHTAQTPLRFPLRHKPIYSESEWNGSRYVKTGGTDARKGPRQEPTIEIEIEGNAPVTATVDTGNSSPLLLSAAYADEVGLLSRNSSTSLSATASGLSTNRLVTVNRVRMGHLAATDVPTEIYATWTANGSPANIGMPMLAGRRLVFDFGQDRLWRSPSTAVPLRRDRSGLGITVKPDRLVVVHVAYGSPAQAAGWRLDEQIIEVNGQRVGPSYNSGDLWRWRFQPAGTGVDLKLADGAVRYLRLGEYY